MQPPYGGDTGHLYSVSKILGHRNLVSAQVYAKVNLEKKMEAVNLTKGVFK